MIRVNFKKKKKKSQSNQILSFGLGLSGYFIINY